MRWRNIFAIVKKDLLEVRQNKAAWLPMIIAPAIIIVVLPLVLLVLPQFIPAMENEFVNDPDLVSMYAALPPAMMEAIEGMTPMQSVVIMMLGYMFAPMFLIFPLAFSTVVAAESFAGERERKTLEALLYTPATEKELFWGKVITGVIPSLAISWGSFVLYTIVLNTAGYPVFHRLWFPLPSWYPLIFWITPALSLLGVAVTVLISSRVQTFMGAYQTSASLVVIVLALLVGQISGVVYLTVGTGLLVGLVFWIVSAALIMLAMRGFKRPTLLLGMKGS
ncbi:MAG: ABC transporter permease subunit [Chloroflexi bacterium]|nr:ABC transporter permease subunit [Chloroflexota bacterium]